VAVVVQERLHLELGGILIPNDFLALGIFLGGGRRPPRRLPGRRWGITTVGTLLDPIADDCDFAALIALVQVGWFPPGW
jgi:hypothetical protein